MAILNFQKRFAGKVRNGRKCQTIRANRKIPIIEGETLYLYTGLRTNHARKLREVPCKWVLDIRLDFIRDCILITRRADFSCRMILHKIDLDFFAKHDGFKNWEDMKAFWSEKHTDTIFEGTLIKW